MKKILVILASLLSLSAISCGEKAPDPDSKQLITFFGWGSTSEQEIFKTMIKEFEKIYTQYKVYYTSSSAETFMTSLAGYRNNPKNMPDVFYMPDTSFVEWINSRNNVMLDLTPYIEKSDVFKLDNVWSEGIRAYQYNNETKKLGSGGIYGLPKDLGPSALTYNKKIVSEKGITIVSDKNGSFGYNPETKTLNDKIPMTWAQFVSFCKDTTSGSLDSSNSIVGITHYPLESAYYSMGGDFTDETRKKANIANDKFAESLQFVADLSNKFKVMTTAEGQVTQNGVARFTSGLAASSFIGVWEIPNLWKVDFDWDILYTPVPNANGDLTDWQDGYREGCSSESYLGSVGLSVYKDSKVKEGAYKLAEFLTVHPVAQRINYQLGQAVPNLKDMANGEFITNPMDDPKNLNRPANREVYVEMMDNSPRRPESFTYNDEWYKEMWESANDATKLYRVWHPGSSSYGPHVDVWDWDSKKRTNTTFLDDLEKSCQDKLDIYTSRYSW